MMEVDADVLLIDEVLAVGDAAFQQKCADAFHEMKAAGKTIVLVTHDMSAVESYCHRAMLLSDGDIQHIGEPDEVGREYLKLNFAPEASPPGRPAPPRASGKGAELLRCLGRGRARPRDLLDVERASRSDCGSRSSC